MSHIFDALQRSEAERSGIGPLPGATDLLQAVERETAVEREAAAEPAAELSREAADSLREGSLSQAAAFQADLSAAARLSMDAGADQLSQFRSLRPLVSPDSKLVCHTAKESLAAEKFRFLGVRMRQLQQRRLIKKVLITSTIPEEGKSIVAANLACALAKRQKILLLEGDLRRPTLSSTFGLGEITGMTEWLESDDCAIPSIYHLEGLGLWILTAGTPHANPLEFMQSGRLSALMNQLTDWFDCIVIDSPPVLPLADASLWMRFADGILLVTRRATTEKQQLEKGLEALERSKLIGAVLNSSNDVAHSDYYRYYGSAAVPSPNRNRS